MPQPTILFFHNYTMEDKDTLYNPVVGKLKAGSKYPDIRIKPEYDEKGKMKPHPQVKILAVGTGWIVVP